MTTAVEPRLLTARFGLVVVCGFSYFVGLGALLPTIPRFVADDLGGGGVAVGVSVGAFALAAVAMRPMIGRFGDRTARRVLMLAGSATMAGSVALQMLVTSVPALVGCRFLGGVGEASFFVGIASMVTDLAPAERRGEAISYWSVSVYGGLSLGPLVGERALRAWGFDGVFATVAVLAMVAFVLVLVVPETGTGRIEAASPRTLLSRPALMPGLGLFLGMTALAAFVTFGPLYVTERAAVSDFGVVFLIYGAIVVSFRFFGARAPDRLGAGRVASGACVLAGAGAGCFALFPSPAGIYAGAALLGIGMSMLYPSLLVLALRGVGPEASASVLGTFTAFFDLAQGGTPVVLGAVVALAGYRASFAVAALCCVAGVAVVRVAARGASAAPPVREPAGLETPRT